MTELRTDNLEQVSGGKIFVTDTDTYVTTDDYNETILCTYSYECMNEDMMEKALMMARKSAAIFGVSTEINAGRPNNYQ